MNPSPTKTQSFPIDANNTHTVLNPGLQIHQTIPDDVVFHGIWDHELDDLTNIGKPIVLGFSTALAGGFLGLVPAIFDAIEHLHGNKFTAKDWSLSTIATACLIGAVILGWEAGKSLRDAQNIKSRIRARPTKPHRRRAYR